MVFTLAGGLMLDSNLFLVAGGRLLAISIVTIYLMTSIDHATKVDEAGGLPLASFTTGRNQLLCISGITCTYVCVYLVS